MAQFVQLAAVMTAGLMTGVELSIAAFVHPTLCHLPDAVHVSAATDLARLLGRVMPVWYGLTLALTALVCGVEWVGSGEWSPYIVLAAVLWVAAIVFSIVALVPINDEVAGWSVDTLPGNWKTYRARWDELHRWRVVLLCVAFGLLVYGLLSE